MGGSAVAASTLLGDETAINIASPSNPEDNDGHKEGGKKKKNRCLSCKRKVGLTGTDLIKQINNYFY
jgi:hypothetical protein